MKFQIRLLTPHDFEDIKDISKDIWEGHDYLPLVFFKWLDATGSFFGVEDIENKKIVAVGKYSILADGSGWLEGLRVHVKYRSLGLARMITEHALSLGFADLDSNNIKRIGFSTHTTNIESRTMMENRNFRLVDTQLIVSKDYQASVSNLSLDDFEVTPLEISFEEIKKLPYFKKRHPLVSYNFVHQHFTEEVFEELKSKGSFIKVNNCPALISFKESINFQSLEEDISSIETIGQYSHLAYYEKAADFPWTALIPSDFDLLESLKKLDYFSWEEDFKPDYLYYVYP